jgi:hypothetical protein
VFNLTDNAIKLLTQSDEYKRLCERIENLENKVKYLEEENIENTNLIYQCLNSIEAVDHRIDIIANEFKTDKNV